MLTIPDISLIIGVVLLHFAIIFVVATWILLIQVMLVRYFGNGPSDGRI
jgi:hypothetical protein